MNNIQTSKILPSTTKSMDKGGSASSNHHSPLRDFESLQDVVAENFGRTVVPAYTSTLTSNATGQFPLSSSLRYP